MCLARPAHEFHEYATHIFRVDEDDRLAVRPDARLTGAKHPGTAFAHGITRFNDVLDLEADMVLTTGRVVFEEVVDRTVIPVGLDEFDLRIW